MSKLALIVGILLMIVAFVALFGFFFYPMDDNPPDPRIANVMDSVFCNPGETYVRQLGGLVSGSGTVSMARELTLYCEDNEGQRREVTGRSIAISVVAFVVAFVGGLLLTIAASFRLTARWSRRLISGAMAAGGPVRVYSNTPDGPVEYSTTVVDAKDGQIPPEAADMIRQVMQGFQGTTPGLSRNDDLSSKLRQLEAARRDGLISQTEYDRVRQQILDSMDD